MIYPPRGALFASEMWLICRFLTVSSLFLFDKCVFFCMVHSLSLTRWWFFFCRLTLCLIQCVKCVMAFPRWQAATKKCGYRTGLHYRGAILATRCLWRIVGFFSKRESITKITPWRSGRSVVPRMTSRFFFLQLRLDLLFFVICKGVGFCNIDIFVLRYYVLLYHKRYGCNDSSACQRPTQKETKESDVWNANVGHKT